MQMRLTKFLSVFLLTAIFIAGCSKNSNSPTEPAAQSPTLPLITFKGPNTTSSDPNAQMVQLYVTAMNAYTTAFAPYAALPSTRNGNTWTWNYSVGTFSIVLTSTVQSDGSYQWKMVMNGVDPSDSTLYNNWTATTGTTSGDGKNGSWNIYETNTTTLVAKYEWTTNNNVLTGTLTSYSSGVVDGKVVVINNPDGSGELDEYTGTVVVYRSVWQANGSGQWWTYDLGGVQTGTGTWS
jgi:hypothetical protein